MSRKEGGTVNRLIQLLDKNQSSGEKLMIMRLNQSLIPVQEIESAVQILKESGFRAVCLVCDEDMEACLKSAAEFAAKDMSVILETEFHKVFLYGIPDFARQAAASSVSGIRVPNLPFEEQGQLAVYLLDEEGPFLIREISASSGDRIVQNMQFARGLIWCTNQGNLDFLSGLDGDPYMFYLFAADAAATQPVIIDFGSTCRADMESYLEVVSGAVAGSGLAEQMQSCGYSADVLKSYCGQFQK